MESIKAIIRGEGVDSSVEFSVEEVIAHQQGKPWGEMSDTEREAAMKDYARFLFTRQSGIGGDLRVQLDEGTFSDGWGGVAGTQPAANGRQEAAQAGHSTQSDYSLSQSAADSGDGDGRFSVAEEVNLDQQSDRMRHVGQMPQDSGKPGVSNASAADAMGKSMKRD